MNLKAKVEAVLFLTDKPIRAQAIARIVNADPQEVRQVVLELIHDYEERNGGLEIAQENGYIIEVKPEYASMMDEFFPIEMSAALLRTLSAIAIKQPVPQSEIIKIRGVGAYDHIRELLKKELINRREEGRSPTLSTTKRFQEYFRLTRDGSTLRKHMKKQEKAIVSEDGTQLNIPLTDEEKARQEQIDQVLEQLLEVAVDNAEGQEGSLQAGETQVAEMQDAELEVAEEKAAARESAMQAARAQAAEDQALQTEESEVLAEEIKAARKTMAKVESVQAPANGVPASETPAVMSPVMQEIVDDQV